MQKKKLENTDTILWDWNGTILNDISICISTMNTLLKSRGIPLLDQKRYQEIFTFPVRDYYEKAGFDFDKEDFDIPATEFINLYNIKVKEAGIFRDSRDVLDFFSQRGYAQYILSAMKQPQLLETISQHNLSHYFEEIHGINDHYANGKEWLADSLIKNKNLDPALVCIIGDTLHDHEIAESMGSNCILVSSGHQSKERLLESGRIVIDEISDIKNLFSKV